MRVRDREVPFIVLIERNARGVKRRARGEVGSNLVVLEKDRKAVNDWKAGRTARASEVLSRAVSTCRERHFGQMIGRLRFIRYSLSNEIIVIRHHVSF